MKNLLFLLASAAMLSGCFVTIIPKVTLDTKASSTMSNKTVVLATSKTPGFSSASPTDGAYAAAGVIVPIEDGNKVIVSQRIPDPALAIGREVAAALASAHGTKTIAAPVMVSDHSPAALAAAGQGTAQYVLDVRTISWGIVNFPHDRTRFRVLYYGSAILVDTDTKASVAQGLCGHYREDSVNAPTFAELTANDAAWLKNELALAVSECVESYKKDVLLIK